MLGGIFASRELIAVSTLLAGSILIGTIRHMFIEGWSLGDSLYMTFITLTTIGFAEVHELSDTQRVFTVLIGLAGIGSVAFVATRTAQILLNTRAFRLRQSWEAPK